LLLSFFRIVCVAYKTNVMEKCGKGHIEIAYNATLFFWSWYLYLCTQILSFCFIRLDAIPSYQSASNYFNFLKYDLLQKQWRNIKCGIMLSGCFNNAFSIPQFCSALCDFILISNDPMQNWRNAELTECS